MMPEKSDIRKNQSGTTLVEMIVCFALIGIFMAATFTAVSSALVSYYHERQIMQAYSVADTVISSIEDDVHTMRPQRAASSDGLVESLDGYVKVREGASSVSPGTTLTAPNKDGGYYGDTLEFVRASSYSVTEDDANDPDVSFAETINSKGFDGTLYKNAEVISVDETGTKGPVTRNAGYLTFRYYSKYEVLGNDYYGLYADQLMTDPTSGPDTSSNISRGLTEKLGVNYYHGMYVDIHFFIPASAMVVDTLSVDDEAKLVRFVQVIVDVYKSFDGTNYSDLLYTKSEYIDIQNDVWLANYSTLFSDGTTGLPAKPQKKDLAETQTFTGTVIWDDNNNSKNKRPTSVAVILTGSDGSTDTDITDASRSWGYEFEVPKYADDGTAITYTVTGSTVELYTMSVSGGDIIYSFDPNMSITFNLIAGEGVNSGQSFSFTVVRQSGSNTTNEYQDFTVGNSYELHYEIDDQITFNYTGNSEYSVDYAPSNSVTVAAGTVVNATISVKQSQLILYTVAQGNYVEGRNPDIRVSVDLDGQSETQPVGTLNGTKQFMQMSGRKNARYNLSIDNRSADYFDLSLVNHGDILDVDPKRVYFTITRKTSTPVIKVVADNTYAANKNLAGAIRVDIDDPFVSGTSNDTLHQTFDANTGAANSEVTVLSGNVQPRGSVITITVNSELSELYDVTMQSPFAVTGNGMTTTGTLSMADPIFIIKLKRKTGWINVEVKNQVDVGNLTDIQTSGNNNNISLTVTGTNTGEGNIYSNTDNYFISLNSGNRSNSYEVPTGTYTITETLPTITTHDNVPKYKLGDNYVGNLSGITVTKDNTNANQVRATIENHFTIKKINLTLKFKFADGQGRKESLLKGITISYTDRYNNTVSQKLSGITKNSDGTYTAIATQIPVGYVKFSIAYSDQLSNNMTISTNYTVTRENPQTGTTTTRTYNNQTEREYNNNTDNITVVFAGDIELRSVSAGNNRVCIGNRYITLGRYYNYNYPSYNYNNSILTLWSYDLNDYISMNGFTIIDGWLSTYYVYDVQNLMYAENDDQNITFGDSSGYGQIWLYNGNYYVQLFNNPSSENVYTYTLFNNSSYMWRIM